MVPTNIKMLSWVNVMRSLEDELRKNLLEHDDYPFVRKEVLYEKALELCLRGLPQDFIDFVTYESEQTVFYEVKPHEEEANRIDKLAYKSHKYSEFETERSEIINLIKEFEIQNYNLDKNPDIATDRQAYNWFQSMTAKNLIRTRWSISPVTREFSYEPVGAIKAFQGMDSRLLRICPECYQVFWAKRLDQSACSKKCSRNFRVHKFREKERQEKKRKEAHFGSRVKKDENF